MPWNTVQGVLLDRVVPLMRPEHRWKGDRWVDQLGRTENGRRLGACIVIDIGGAVDAQIFASILEHLDFTKESAQKDACWAFDDAIQNHPENRDLPDKSRFVCASCYVADSVGQDQAYVRVLDLREFIEYMLKPSGAPMSSLRDPGFARDAYFSEEDEGMEWDDIEQEWSGRFGRVFVTSLAELDQLIADSPDPGGAVNDALGLGLPPSVEFVAVKYPSGFSEKCHQPTTLDVYWGYPNWYVSHKQTDAWGRTHSCSGTGRNARERVHRKLSQLAAGYSGRHIGAPKGAPVTDLGRLEAEAFNRL